MTNDVLRVEGATAAPRKSFLKDQLAAGHATADASAEYAKDSTLEKLPEDSLAALKAMAEELLAAEREVAHRARDLQTAVSALADVQEHRLPDLMERVDLPKFVFYDRTTDRNRIIKLDSKWRVQMPAVKDKDGNTIPGADEKRARIFEWFRSIGKGGVIKKDMTIPMGLVSDDVAAALMMELRESHPELDPGLTEKIEPATLTAQIRRLKEAGENVHEDIVCTPVRKATVTDK